MNRFSKIRLFPWAPLLAGIVGFALQIWLFSLEDAKGLLPQGHISEILSFILLALVVAVCWFGVQNSAPTKDYCELFPTSKVAAVGGLIGAAGMGFSAFMLPATGFLRYLIPVFGLLGAGALVAISYCRFEGRQPNSMLHGAITVYLILRTMGACRIWGAEPQLQVYFFQLMASLFLLLACYYRAALDLQAGNSRMYVFFSQAALFCCCLCVPGGDWLFYLSAGIWMATDYCTPPSYGRYA